LCTLRERGFVRQNPETSEYALGLPLVQLGQVALERIDYRRESLPFLRYLMQVTGETANLVVLDGDEAVYVERVVTKTPLGIFSRIGHRAPVHATAVGKALLCDVSDQDMRELLGAAGMVPLTAKTITDFDRYWEELQRTRRLGYATDDEECAR